MSEIVDSYPSEEGANGVSRWFTVPRRVMQVLLCDGPRHLWVLSFLILVAVAAWAYFDPLFNWTIAGSDFLHLNQLVDNIGGRSTADWGSMISDVDRRSTLLASLVLFKLTIIVLLIYGLIRGPKPYRSLKAFLMMMTLASLWIGLAFSLSNIAWYGKQARIGRLLGKFEPIVAELNETWPKQDSQSPTLGPFKAYPINNPTTLILMVSPPLPESEVRLTEVIRSDEGALRFSLAGSELGDWVEWHPPGSQPASFRSGLDTDYNFSRTTDLGNSWYLVRYNW